jgi:ribosomal protein S11
MPKPYIFKKKDSKQVNVIILRQKLKNQINNTNIEIAQKKSHELVSPLKKHYVKPALKSKKLDKLIVNLMFTRTYSNVFLTAINYKGDVLVQQSTGLCSLHSKKKKRSWDALKSLAQSLGNKLRTKNIKLIKIFYMKYHYLKNYKIIITILKKSGILVKRLVYYNNKTHSLLMRKKKLRRI